MQPAVALFQRHQSHDLRLHTRLFLGGQPAKQDFL
jgi:hypothetical protein